jgi:xanthine/uracil permease
MTPFDSLRRHLLVSGAVMLVGVVLLLAPQAMAWVAPLWWRRVAASVILIGALAEILAVWRFRRRRS